MCLKQSLFVKIVSAFRRTTAPGGCTPRALSPQPCGMHLVRPTPCMRHTMRLHRALAKVITDHKFLLAFVVCSRNLAHNSLVVRPPRAVPNRQPSSSLSLSEEAYNETLIGQSLVVAEAEPDSAQPFGFELVIGHSTYAYLTGSVPRSSLAFYAS
jgi:hypothetical protein